MNKDVRKIYIGVAWPYVNGDQHVGHLAGYLLPADIMARYFRLRGDDVLMVSGSDCYGTPITLEADKLGISYEEVVNKYHPSDIMMFKKFDLSYNLYTKTTTKNHSQVVQELFLRLLENGFINIKTQLQYYSAIDDKFLPDRYVEGICPYCSSVEQRGDQCEKCGKMIESGALIDPVSKITGQKVELKESDHYYLDLSRLNDKIEKFVDDHQGIWRKWVYAEAKGWIKEGLHERAITRDIDWGVKLPTDKISEDMMLTNVENKRFYVWFDAVTGYLSAAREWSKTDERNDDIIFNVFDGQDRDWRNWWQNSEARHFYFLGQDNLVFHTLMWPAQLMGADENLNLPYNVVTSKFMNLEGKKFSKSRNWTISPMDLAAEFGVDAVRYYVASVLPENKEADFTWESFIDGVNNELIANIGNLVNRTLAFYNKHWRGEEMEVGEIDLLVKKDIDATFLITAGHLEKAEIKEALMEIMKLGFFGNKFFNDSKVWEVVKDDKEQAKKIMQNLLQILVALSVLLIPYIPQTAFKLREYLGLEEVLFEVGNSRWQMALKKVKVAEKIEPLFQKIDREVVLDAKKEKIKQ